MKGLSRGTRRKVRPGLFALAALLGLAPAGPVRSDEFLLVVGAPGEPDYAPVLAETADAWLEAAGQAGLSATQIRDFTADGVAPRDQLIAALSRIDSAGTGTAPLWFVYVGHGSFDLRTARLNLHGPDVSSAELQSWLERLGRPLVFVHGGSASAPFVNALSRPDRIIITATESGHEVNYARFGLRFARAVVDPAADIDRDGQTSLLEAFVTAAQQVQAFYLENNRLATEHALIDDNGDGRGTPFDFFSGTRVTERPADAAAEPDGARARLWSLLPSPEERALSEAQRTRRDELESELEKLRARRDSLSEAEYLDAIEPLFRALAEIYASGAP